MTLLLIFFLLGINTTWMVSNAQDPPTDPCEVPQNPDEPPVYCPIDGGLAFLLAAGVGYGVLKNRTAHQGKKEEEPSGNGLL